VPASDSTRTRANWVAKAGRPAVPGWVAGRGSLLGPGPCGGVERGGLIGAGWPGVGGWWSGRAAGLGVAAGSGGNSSSS